MLETPHVIVAAALASKIGTPYSAIPLVFASHFLLDITPHWNPSLTKELKTHKKITGKTKKIILIDSTFALISGLYIANQFSFNYSTFFVILLACFVAIIPDLTLAPYFFLNRRSKNLLKWYSFKKSVQNNTSLSLGVMTQIITIAAAIYWLYS